MDLSFYKGKSVFVTGHTGFKGAWLCRVLKHAGAAVTGYALEPEPGCVYEIADVADGIRSVYGDVRDLQLLSETFEKAQPEIVFHLAAQPIVLESYKRPAYTFETNTMGTVHLLECIRLSKTVRSVVIITTDKVYMNSNLDYSFKESDTLGGNDPYAASKACAEMVCHCYRKSFLQNIPLSTTRAGNVIGGGDISDCRIVPDCVRAAKRGETIIVRNPRHVRPFQHVLEPLLAYLLIGEKQYSCHSLADSYNIGPADEDCVSIDILVDLFCKYWSDGITWDVLSTGDAPEESILLKLDCSKIRSVLAWKPVWGVEEAMRKTVEFEKAFLRGENAQAVMDRQIDEYIELIC